MTAGLTATRLVSKPARRRTWQTAAAVIVLSAVAIGSAWAYWSPGSTAGSNGASAAASVAQGATPTATATSGSTVTVAWAATTLTSGAPVGGYLVTRYSSSNVAQTTLSACAGTITALSCVESSVPDGTWTYTVTPVLAANWRGPESAKSAPLTTETVAPTNAVTVTGVVGGAVRSGNIVYYRGVANGSFTLTNAVSDAGSGPASSQTAALGGTTTGWTHAPSTVSAPTGGPYVSNTFLWTAGATSAPTETVTGRDVAGNAATTNLTFTNDSTAPTPGSISYANGPQGTTSIQITFAAGTDAQSGIATRQLQRSYAPLTGGACGSYNTYISIGGASPVSPYTDNAVGAGACYQYRYVVADAVGNQDVATSTNAATFTYSATVAARTGVVNYYRLGEAVVTNDTFTAATGTALTARSGELGASWTAAASATNDTNAVVTAAGRLRKAGTSTLQAIYLSSGIPPTADYSVEADVYVASNLTNDVAGVIGRADPASASGTFYIARFDQQSGAWILSRVVNGTYTDLGQTTATLTAGTTYQLSLAMKGSAIRLNVNGVETVSVVDASPIVAIGRGGVALAAHRGGAGTTVTDSTGMQLDNFRVLPAVVDNTSNSNSGVAFGGTNFGVTGALSGDSNTAMSFDGVSDFVRVPRQIVDDFSIEFWFKSTQGIGTGTNWWEGAALVDADVQTAGLTDFGVSLRSDGRVVGGIGNPDTSVVSSTGGFNDGAWHHVVFTRSRTTGLMQLYVDATSMGTATGSTSAANGSPAITFGQQASGGKFFAGTLDEIALYGSVLTASQISGDYALRSATAPDASGPTGGYVAAIGLSGTGAAYSTSTTLGIGFAAGSDPSGMAGSGYQLTRATASLTSTAGANGVCGTYGSYLLVTGGTDAVSPKSDTVTDQACYRYQYTVADSLGNLTTYTSSDIKLDGTAPAAPTLAYSALVNSFWSAAAPTVLYYRPTAAAGSFTVTAVATDAASGIASYGYPALGTGWTSTPGATGVNTYSWSATNPAAASGASITATSNAGATSAATAFTLTADTTAPTAGTVNYPDGATTGTSVSISFATGTDAGSGIGTRLLQRASATLTSGNCGTFGTPATVVGGTNPTSSPLTDTVTSGFCYKYQYLVSDNVGNTAIVTSANVVKATLTYGAAVTGTSGIQDYFRLNEAAGNNTAADSVGTTNGTYLNGPTRGVAGALTSGDPAVQFDGVDDYVSVPKQLAGDFSIEFWFKSTQGIGTGTNWWNGAGLVDADTVTGGVVDFGVSLRSDGKVVAGAGNADASVISSTGGFNNGAWHHVVFTRTMSTGLLQLYVDGASMGSTTGSTGASTTTLITFGRIAAGGNYFAGTLDEVSLYNTPLSPATITTHYAAR